MHDDLSLLDILYKNITHRKRSAPRFMFAAFGGSITPGRMLALSAAPIKASPVCFALVILVPNSGLQCLDAREGAK
jgi:hypothetical protein